MRKVAWLIIPIAIVGMLAVVVFAARPPANATAFTLNVGDCFDIPDDAQIGDIATLTCDRHHDAEVFRTGAIASDEPSVDPSSGPDPYPGADSIAAWVGSNCGPSDIARYTGATPNTALAVGYFFPDENAWSRGERQITCYLHTRDGSALSGTLRSPNSLPTDGAGASPS